MILREIERRGLDKDALLEVIFDGSLSLHWQDGVVLGDILETYSKEYAKAVGIGKHKKSRDRDMQYRQTKAQEKIAENSGYFPDAQWVCNGPDPNGFNGLAERIEALEHHAATHTHIIDSN